MIHGDLFSGIGGFSLAARWLGWRTAWFSEIDPYACRVLARHWPTVPNFGDITAVDWGQAERVDILTGGFPCQDISSLGTKRGIRGPKSGLWSEYARAIRELHPRWVVIENVAVLLRRGFDVVRHDLRAAGYRVARPVLMSGAACGAPIGGKGRDRLWIVATTHSRGCGWSGLPRQAEWPALAGTSRCGCVGDGLPRAAPDHWEAEPRDMGMADGIPSRMDRIRALGNAVDPRCAFPILRAIADAEACRKAEAAWA